MDVMLPFILLHDDNNDAIQVQKEKRREEKRREEMRRAETRREERRGE
jgi:hypothetical protein